MLDHISPILLLITIIVVTMLVFFGLYKTLSLFVPWAEVRWGVLFLVALSLLQLVYHFATTTRAEDIAIVHIFSMCIVFFSLLTFLCIFIAVLNLVMRFVRN